MVLHSTCQTLVLSHLFWPCIYISVGKGSLPFSSDMGTPPTVLQQQTTDHVLDIQRHHHQGTSCLMARCMEAVLTHCPAELAASCHQKPGTCLSSDPMLVTKPDGNHVVKHVPWGSHWCKQPSWPAITHEFPLTRSHHGCLVSGDTSTTKVISEALFANLSIFFVT